MGGHRVALDAVDLQILVLLSQGLDGRQIGRRLDLKERTVQRRTQGLREALHARTTIAAVAAALRAGLID